MKSIRLALGAALMGVSSLALPVLATPAVAHRITLRPEMWVRKIQGSDVVEDLLRRLPVPRTGAGPQ